MEESRCNMYMHREALAWAPKKKRLPVTLVTGFLGSGKTTLLTHILTNKHNLKIAAAVNDFASLNVDGQIVRATGHRDGVVELSNGCLCCSVSGEFQKAVWQLLEDADIGKIDYLVVETSGITDPLQTISTLEQEYGRMYRVRLDVVVTVVDTDALVTKITAPSSQKGAILDSMAADSQLKCADVVLLNKMDLVSENQLELAKGFVESKVPGVVVRTCSRCAVPLNWIMEVNEVSSGPQVVSHEVTSAAYTINQEGGVKNAARQSRDIAGASRNNHLSADDFSSLVFESPAPFVLERFQHFLGSGFPGGLARMKGTVWFAENRSHVYSFHMSGRNRYELTPQLTPLSQGAFSVELVAIGKNMEKENVLKLLNECVCNESDTVSLPSKERHRELRQLIESHDYFVFSSNEEEGLPYVDFRVTGCIDYGVTEEEAAGFHGINFTRMNSDVASRVNGCSDRVSLLPVMLPSGVQVCRHGLWSGAGFERAWDVITGVAERLVTEYYRAVGVCKCGR